MTLMTGAPGAGSASPPLESFCKAYDAGAAQAVWTRLVADLETPVSAFLKLAGGQPNSFLLESVEGGAVRGRYSIIGFAPDVIWRAEGNRARVNRAPANGGEFEACEGGTLESLRALLAE